MNKLILMAFFLSSCGDNPTPTPETLEYDRHYEYVCIHNREYLSNYETGKLEPVYVGNVFGSVSVKKCSYLGSRQ